MIDLSLPAFRPNTDPLTVSLSMASAQVATLTQGSCCQVPYAYANVIAGTVSRGLLRAHAGARKTVQLTTSQYHAHYIALGRNALRNAFL